MKLSRITCIFLVIVYLYAMYELRNRLIECNDDYVRVECTVDTKACHATFNGHNNTKKTIYFVCRHESGSHDQCFVNKAHTHIKFNAHTRDETVACYLGNSFLMLFVTVSMGFAFILLYVSSYRNY